MAEDEQKYVTYKTDKAKYNKQCVNQWSVWFDKFKPRLKENIQLFSNYSEDLAKRKDDETLSRACLFIPVINPAVLSRAAHMTNLMHSVDQPIEVIAKRGTPQEIAENVKLMIHGFLEKDEFKLTFLKMKIAQETIPISFLKVSEFEDEEKVLQIRDEKKPLESDPHYKTELGKFKHWETEKGEWRPGVTLYTQEAVFYDPDPAEWKDKTFVGIITPLTFGELVARKITMKYTFDDEELKKNGEEWADEFTDELRSATARETKGGVKKGQKRYKVIENYHKVEDDDGKILRKITTTCGDIELLDRDFPYEKLDITDLFIEVIGYPILNQVEGNTTTDLLKHLQHAINDFFNIIIDAGKYGLFPPRLRDSRARILNKQITGPGCEWLVDMQAGGDLTLDKAIKQMFTVTPMSKDFFALVDVLREIAEIVSGTPEDLLMGAATDPQEKATKTKLRAQGASARLAGINLLMDVGIMKKLAYVMWVMTLERLPYGDTYEIERAEGEPVELDIDKINGRLDFDVPHLSGMAEREIKVARLKELLVTLNELGLFGHPAMLPVLYILLKKIADASLIADFEEIFPPDLIPQIQQSMVMQGMQGGKGGAGEGGGGMVGPLETAQKLMGGGG